QEHRDELLVLGERRQEALDRDVLLEPAHRRRAPAEHLVHASGGDALGDAISTIGHRSPVPPRRYDESARPAMIAGLRLRIPLAGPRRPRLHSSAGALPSTSPPSPSSPKPPARPACSVACSSRSLCSLHSMHSVVTGRASSRRKEIASPQSSQTSISSAS